MATAEYPWLRAVGSADLAHETPWFLAALNAVGERLGRVLDVFSGARSPAHNAAVAGAAQSQHLYGTRRLATAADVTVAGVPLGRVRGAHAAIAGAGLVSGDQPGFFRGSPDPAHVQAPAGRRGGGASDRLVALWLGAGGEPSLAETMAAIALAESGGRASAHNFNILTTEDSRGVWQINVGPRANPQYASWDLYNPAVNARAAVAIHRSQGLGAWSTYTNGAYLRHLRSSAQPGGAVPAGTLRARPDADGGIGGFLGKVAGAGESAAGFAWRHAVDVAEGPFALLKTAMWLLDPRTWLRAVEFAVGMVLMLLGLLGLATVMAARNPTVKGAAAVAAAAPGPVGAVGKAITVAGASGKRRTAAASQLAPAGVREQRAERQGARQQLALEESNRLAKARERGRRRERARVSEAAFRARHPDYDVIPF